MDRSRIRDEKAVTRRQPVAAPKPPHPLRPRLRHLHTQARSAISLEDHTIHVRTVSAACDTALRSGRRFVVPLPPIGPRAVDDLLGTGMAVTFELERRVMDAKPFGQRPLQLLALDLGLVHRYRAGEDDVR